MSNPVCFVLMPYEVKRDPAGGGDIDFDRIYREALKPAIIDAGLQPVRADEERTGGIIHKAMFERLCVCEYAVADLTTASANVFYELGVRHAARPRTTVAVFARRQPIPFDVTYLRAIPYDLGDQNRFGPEEAAALRQAVAAKLKDLRAIAAQQALVDSPVFDLVDGWVACDVSHLRTDAFFEELEAEASLKRRLAAVRSAAAAGHGRDAASADLVMLRTEIGTLDGMNAGVVLDLLATYRALDDWTGMINVVHDMPETLANQVAVRQQLAFAHNRRCGAAGDPADRDEALRILTLIEDEQGANAETCGLIGRIWKDRWAAARDSNPMTAKGHLGKAIDAYERGFQADPRDAYPGINAVTLLDIRGDPASLARKAQLAPVVRFAVERRLAARSPDYWDYATRLELALLEDDETEAIANLSSALASVTELWAPTTTADNLRSVERARQERGAETALLRDAIAALDDAARPPPAPAGPPTP